MKKNTLGAASFYKKGYSFNPEFDNLPMDIKNEIRIICTYYAEKLHGVFTMGFYEDGSVYFEAFGDESDYDYDEIGSKLEIDKLAKEKNELIRALGMWYSIFKTQEGKQLLDGMKQ